MYMTLFKFCGVVFLTTKVFAAVVDNEIDSNGDHDLIEKLLHRKDPIAFRFSKVLDIRLDVGEKTPSDVEDTIGSKIHRTPEGPPKKGIEDSSHKDNDFNENFLERLEEMTNMIMNMSAVLNGMVHQIEELKTNDSVALNGSSSENKILGNVEYDLEELENNISNISENQTSNDISDIYPLKKKHTTVYWNIPTFQCNSHKFNFSLLAEKYKIVQNANDRFRGQSITILYNPGLFPAILKDGSKTILRNGGIPQEGNLTEHLEVFAAGLEELIPDEKFSGIGIIEFESWRPIFRQNFGVLSEYKKLSISIEERKHPTWPTAWIEKEAASRFETFARMFMEQTLLPK